MSDSGKATKEKDGFVAKQTRDFIKSTPTTFNNNMYIDVMNVTYFEDSWYDGEQ